MSETLIKTEYTTLSDLCVRLSRSIVRGRFVLRLMEGDCSGPAHEFQFSSPEEVSSFAEAIGSMADYFKEDGD